MPQKSEIYTRRAALTSLYCNIVLVILKSIALILVNSLAIAMDLGISFVGLTVSVILYYSIKLANKPADLFHNYGYGKVENVCEGIEGIVLIGIALAMSSQALMNFLSPEAVSRPWLGFTASVLSVLINFGGAVYILKMARKSASPAIHAEGLHYMLEGFISGIIACAFVLTMIMISAGFGPIAVYLDPLAALITSIVVIIPSFKLAKASFFKLLDASMEEGSQMEILKRISRHIEKFCEFKDIRTRTSGRMKFIDFKVVVPEDLSLKEGFKVINAIENDIKEGVPYCEVQIRMEPCKKDCKFFLKNKHCPYLQTKNPANPA